MTETPTTPEEAAAMVAALNAYHAAKLIEARKFVGSETFDGFRILLEDILAEGLPDGSIKALIQSIVSMVNALTTVAANEPSEPPPTPPDLP